MRQHGRFQQFELVHLFKIQLENGSWVNSKSNRWFEGDPNLVTAYTLLALKNCETTPAAD